MILRELVTRLGFEADNRGANRHESALQSVRRAAVGLTAAYTATVGAAGALAVKLAGDANVVAKSAAEAGLAADEYQRLGFALGQVSQASQADVDRALGRLSQRIGRAREEGGKYADALIAMGYSQEQIASGAVTTSGAMEALTEQVSRAQNAQQASAIAGELLGTRIGRRLGPALYANADAFREQQKRAEELGGGWSDLALKEGEALTDTVAEVGLITTSLSSTLAETLVPAVNSAISGFVDWYTANREIIMLNFRRYLEVVGSAVQSVTRVLGAAAKVINTVADRLGGWERILRIVTAAALGFVALKLGGVLWGIAAAFTGAGAAVRVMRLAVMALSRLPIIALMVGLGLAIEDLIVWINGGDSAIGRWLGSWEDFSAKVERVVADVLDYIQPLIKQFESIGKILKGVFTLDGAKIIQGFKDLGDSTLEWASQLASTISSFLMDALSPNISAVMAGMRELGDDLLKWAKSMGNQIARYLLPDATHDFFGVSAAPEQDTTSSPGNGSSGGWGDSDSDRDRDHGSSGGWGQEPPTSPGDRMAGAFNTPTPEPLSVPAPRVEQPSPPVIPEARRAADDVNGRMAGAFNTPTPERVRENVTNSNTNTRNVSVNARIDSTVQVPPGTPDDQQAAIRGQVETAFDELFNREINRALTDMPEAT